LGIELGEETDETVKYKDAVTGKVFPRHILQCALDTSEGIVNQDADVFEVLRELMYDLDKWDRPEDSEDESASEAEAAAAADAEGEYED